MRSAATTISYALGRFVGRPRAGAVLARQARDEGARLGEGPVRASAAGSCSSSRVTSPAAAPRRRSPAASRTTRYPRFLAFDALAAVVVGDVRVAARLSRRRFLPRPRMARAAGRVRASRALHRCASRASRTAARVNRLAQETSPYLLQHAGNPVDWYPWGDEALARARDEDRPILLSIGYAACHWCHVMERESFEDAADGARDERALRLRSRSTARSGPTSTRSTWTRSSR